MCVVNGGRSEERGGGRGCEGGEDADGGRSEERGGGGVKMEERGSDGGGREEWNSDGGRKEEMNSDRGRGEEEGRSVEVKEEGEEVQTHATGTGLSSSTQSTLQHPLHAYAHLLATNSDR